MDTAQRHKPAHALITQSMLGKDPIEDCEVCHPLIKVREVAPDREHLILLQGERPKPESARRAEQLAVVR
jgi:hypothetical protein